MLLLCGLLCVLCFASSASAFGAGKYVDPLPASSSKTHPNDSIPTYAYLEGKAFRHGDLEDILAELARKGGSGGAAALLTVIGCAPSKSTRYK